MGEHAQLDLVVVGRQQAPPRLRDEGGAQRSSELGADRNVLQVRVYARQPAGCRRHLVEGRVDAAGLGIDQLGQRVEVGVLELRQLAPALDLLDDRMLVADLRQHPGVGREAGLAAPLLRQPQLLEQHRRELLRRADRELVPGEVPDLVLKLVGPAGDPRRHLLDALRVDEDPGALHRRQHLDQRHLDVGQQRLEPQLLEPLALAARELPHQAGLGGRVGRRPHPRVPRARVGSPSGRAAARPSVGREVARGRRRVAPGPPGRPPPSCRARGRVPRAGRRPSAPSAPTPPSGLEVVRDQRPLPKLCGQARELGESPATTRSPSDAAQRSVADGDRHVAGVRGRRSHPR